MGEYVFQFHALVHPTKAGIARRETEKFCEIEKQIQGFFGGSGTPSIHI